MSAVDPWLSPIPRRLIEDPEMKAYFENLHRFLHDLWIRTGGPVDSTQSVVDVLTGVDDATLPPNSDGVIAGPGDIRNVDDFWVWVSQQ